MRTISLLLLATLIAHSLSPSWALAHDPGHGNAVLSDETVEALHEHLTESLAEALRHGAPDAASDATQAGQRLLDAVYADIMADLKEQHPSLAKEATEKLGEIIKAFNPIALGRWLLLTARRQGPGLAIAYGLSEVTEQVGMLLSVKYHALLFLVPLSVTHMTDVIVLSTVLGLPRAVRLINLWRRFGGIVSGPGAYYDHLATQRAMLPIDWSVVLNVGSLKLDLSDGTEDVQFAVISENALERALPRALRVVFDPRKLVQREAVPTFSIAELEQIAKGAGVDLRQLRAFKGEPGLYSTILLREISLHDDSAERFTTEVRIRNEKSTLGGVTAPGNAWSHARLIDAEDILSASTPDALERLANDAGETPDLIAQRALWFLESEQKEYEEQLDQLEKAPKSDAAANLKDIQKNYRKLGALLGPGQGLARIAASPFASPAAADWAGLQEQLKAAAGLRFLLNDALPARHPERCEALLLGA